MGKSLSCLNKKIDCHNRRLFGKTDVIVENLYEEFEKRLKGTEVVDLQSI